MLQDLRQGVGLRQGKPGGHGAPQGEHGPAAAQSPANVVAQGAHIGALGAPHPDKKVGAAHLLLHRQGVDGDVPGRPLHLSALPGQLVELLSLDLDGGVHGGDLLNVPPEGFQGCLQRLQSDVCGVGLQHRAGGVLGVGDLAQTQAGQVLLLPLAGELHRPGGPAHKHREHPGGHGVQSTRVADAPLAQHPPQLGAHIHTGPILGFIDN